MHVITQKKQQNSTQLGTSEFLPILNFDPEATNHTTHIKSHTDLPFLVRSPTLHF